MKIIFDIEYYYNCSKNISYIVKLSKLIYIDLQIVLESAATVLKSTLTQERNVWHILHSIKLTPIELGLTLIVKDRWMICCLRTRIDTHMSRLPQKEDSGINLCNSFEPTPTKIEPTPPQVGVDSKIARADSKTAGKKKWLVF